MVLTQMQNSDLFSNFISLHSLFQFVLVFIRGCKVVVSDGFCQMNIAKLRKLLNLFRTFFKSHLLIFFFGLGF